VDAERRQVTVVFTDMVGFTAFSERSGEEAAYILMRSLSKLMDETIREQGGGVQGLTGVAEEGMRQDIGLNSLSIITRS
jgi:class 3 adenylate cyclase